MATPSNDPSGNNPEDKTTRLAFYFLIGVLALAFIYLAFALFTL